MLYACVMGFPVGPWRAALHFAELSGDEMGEGGQSKRANDYRRCTYGACAAFSRQYRKGQSKRQHSPGLLHEIGMLVDGGGSGIGSAEENKNSNDRLAKGAC
jgi:hypothetical protein